MKKFLSILTVLLFVFAFNATMTQAAALTGVVYGPSGSVVGTYVPASSILGMFTTTTAVTTGSTIVLDIPDNSVINATAGVTVASDFTIQELGAGSAPTAPSALAYDQEAHTITLTVAAASLSTDTAGIGSFVVKTSSTAGGNEIKNPEVAVANGAFTVTTSVGDTATISDVVFIPGAAAKLIVTGMTDPVVAGVEDASVSVTAKDAYDNTAVGYTGTVHFTSNDTQAVLPADYAFQAGDAGTHVFAVTLKTIGEKTLTATDTVTSTITGNQSDITVTVAGKSKIAITAEPTVGYTYSAFSTQPLVEIQDAFGNKTADADKISIAAYSDETCTTAIATNFTGTKTATASAGLATFSGIKYDTVRTAGLYLGAWLDINGDGIKDAGETWTDCSSLFKIYANTGQQVITSSGTTAPTTTTTAPATPTITTTTTTAPAPTVITSIPQPIKPINQMTQAEKNDYTMTLQQFLIQLLTQLLNLIKAQKGL